MNGHAREQVIRERAYHIWETRGRVGGKDLEHWLQAEREMSEAIAATETVAPKAAAPKAEAAAPAKTAAKGKKTTKAATKAPAKPRSKKKS